MTAPNDNVRKLVYQRDGERCIACGRQDLLEFQHRQAVGMGGSDHRVNVWEGLTACRYCNAAFEAHLQATALLRGWKVRRWVPFEQLLEVPVYYPLARAWYLLDRIGGRTPIDSGRAMQLMVDLYGALLYQQLGMAAAHG
ncbi:HNH endonuclease [Gryllotalpicola protaetiae]|uniref:HNH endonuclease n=1 Tax=Gryllotalpicola protaetiae TaxID=2419771 RepID=A0A387BJG6_9MICO|nr:hypothetical protein [Gryllotalpicola protaetiae]AYG02392.1 hypothetical protein D7I44_01805 [Gryllotalpicola protaetiae]